MEGIITKQLVLLNVAAKEKESVIRVLSDALKKEGRVEDAGLFTGLVLE